MVEFHKFISFYLIKEWKMARLFSDKYDSDKVRIENEKTEPKKLKFVAFEGVVTEPDYFNRLSQYVKDSKDFSVKIFPVERNKGDGRSHPNHVRDGLYEYYNERLRGSFKSSDELWIIIDIDQHFSGIRNKTTEEVYNLFLESLELKSPKINAAISNPSFELWLLLHLIEAEKLDLGHIKENRKISAKKTYIKKLLIETVNLVEEKSGKIDYPSKTNIALNNSLSSLLKCDNNELIKNVGTSMGKLLLPIFKY